MSVHHKPIPYVTHRPGAVFVKAAKVSMTRGEYRLLIDLPTYDYSMEFSALKDLQATINKSQVVLDTLDQNLPKSQPAFKQKLMILFQDIAGRLSRALVHFRHQSTTLNSLMSRHVGPAQLKETMVTDNPRTEVPGT